MFGRLVQATDFQRLLATPARGRGLHFAVHHLRDRPADRSRAAAASLREDVNLSTANARLHPQAVDDTTGVRQAGVETEGLPASREGATALSEPTQRWLGCVVPKRQARRAVTRSMIKRQMRAAMQRHENALAPGLWLVRLRQGFPVTEYPSADSVRLRLAVRSELEQLLGRVARRTASPVPSQGGEGVARRDPSRQPGEGGAGNVAPDDQEGRP